MAEEVLGERDEPECSDLELSGREIEQISLEDDLADAFAEWVRLSHGEYVQRFEDRRSFVDLLRDISHYHPSGGQALDPSVTDQQLFDAARDAYTNQLGRRQ
jgi:hypothetical protein